MKIDLANSPLVILAKAGIQSVVAAAPMAVPCRTAWIPACAGMTGEHVHGLGVAAYLQPFYSDTLEH
ncbi:MAG: hypothetical protein ACKOF9_00735 [Burkholderiales bacterium]